MPMALALGLLPLHCFTESPSSISDMPGLNSRNLSLALLRFPSHGSCLLALPVLCSQHTHTEVHIQRARSLPVLTA